MRRGYNFLANVSMRFVPLKRSAGVVLGFVPSVKKLVNRKFSNLAPSCPSLQRACAPQALLPKMYPLRLVATMRMRTSPTNQRISRAKSHRKCTHFVIDIHQSANFPRKSHRKCTHFVIAAMRMRSPSTNQRARSLNFPRKRDYTPPCPRFVHQILKVIDRRRCTQNVPSSRSLTLPIVSAPHLSILGVVFPRSLSAYYNSNHTQAIVFITFTCP